MYAKIEKLDWPPAPETTKRGIHSSIRRADSADKQQVRVMAVVLSKHHATAGLATDQVNLITADDRHGQVIINRQ